MFFINEYDNEKLDIQIVANNTTILDVKNLRIATTTFLHKIIDVKESIILINLNGQPKQVFNICGLDKIIRTCENIEEAKKLLTDK